ncbi:putative phage abortive infection protein [Cytobacillus praedii]|uniref:putative phage abortive infection protein n=1 Tax=Cytobacillus praedii TaxID=1742358 RepID=UPI003F807CD4
MRVLTQKFGLWISRKENIVIIIGGVIALIALSTPFTILFKTGWIISYEQFEKLGVVGDFFGGTTVGLLSLASIVFVIAAIVMQKEELALQREEVKKTREEYEVTNQTMKKQQFDNTFFNMISLHNDILNTIEVKQTDFSFPRAGGTFVKEKIQVFKSRSAIEYLYKEINVEFNVSNNSYEMLENVYEKFYSKHQNIIGHYYRNMYRIVKLIIDNKLQKEDEKFYLGVFRAQLSSFELVMLFYNISYSEAGVKFKRLLRGKNFFQKHIPSELFINSIDMTILKEIEEK